MAVRLVSVKPMSTAVVRTDPSSASAQSAAKVPGSGGRPAAEETATRTVPENSSSSSRSVRTAVATSTGSGRDGTAAAGAETDGAVVGGSGTAPGRRSEEHKSELQARQ